MLINKIIKYIFGVLPSVVVCVVVCVVPMTILPLTSAFAQQTAQPFTIGVLPNVNARLIINSYQPMRSYFQRELKRSIEVATAADFSSFHEFTRRGEYDLIVTAPNLGRVAQTDFNWQPLAMYEPKIPALLVAMADNTHAAPLQLRGKSIAMANPQSLVALVGLKWLDEQGLKLGRDFKILTTANDDSLGAVLKTGEAPLAIMSMGEFRAKPEQFRKSLRIVTEIAKLPGFLVMANPTLSAADAQRVKALILAFPLTEDGKKFFALSGFSHIRETNESELKFLDKFTDETRLGLAGSK